MRASLSAWILRRPRSLGVCCAWLACVGCSDDGPSRSGDASTRDAPADFDTAGLDTAHLDTAEPDADASRTSTTLVDHDLWDVVPLENDPFDDAPETVECDQQAFGTEEISPEWTFFVRTQGCNYLTVAQPTLGDIAAGETVNVRLWHFALTAPAASEAHLAVRIGEHTLWQTYVPIPSESALLVDTWTAPETIPAGEAIYFHVHNHGDNEYNLIEVSVSR